MLLQQKHKGGSAISLILIVTFMIVFIILPIGAFAFEQLKLQIVEDNVSQAVETAALDTYHALNFNHLALGEFTPSTIKFEYLIKKKIIKALKLNNNMSPKETSILDGVFSLDHIEFIGTHALPYKDQIKNITYTRPVVIIQFTIRIKPMFYREYILNALGKEYIAIQSKKIVTLPVNN